MSQRNRRRAVLAVAIVQILVGTMVLGYRWMTTSTEPDVSEAVERYRERGDAPPADPTPPPAAELALGDDLEDPSEGDGDASDEADDAPAVPSGSDHPEGTRFSSPPQPGVYEWKQDGSEQVGGVNRDLPERSVRVVTLTDDGWVDEHRYSEQHIREVAMGVADQGVYSERSRTRISFGPFSGDNRMEFEPPLRVGVFPFEVGQRWEGSFTGETSGTYSGRTLERTSLRIGTEDVEVWGIEVKMHLTGDLEGDLLSRVWVSPAYRMAVKEFHDQKVRSGGVNYTGRWTITLLDTNPQR